MGTAGGVKTTTLAVLVMSIIANLRGKKDVEVYGRKIRSSYIRSAQVVVGMAVSVLLLSTPGYMEYKGALAENYVLQSLTAQFQASFRYWTSGNKAEVDFLLQYDNHIYPIEVKADQNVTGKSLIQYEKLFQPVYRIRYSMLNLKQDGNLINIPLFLADKTKELLKDKS